MKAIQINQYGGPEVLEVNDIPEPEVSAGKILVQVYAASINPFDYKLRSGMFKEQTPTNFLFTMGNDFAGVVTKVGEGVTDFKEGDEVYGAAIILNGGSGAFAQNVASTVKNSALKPKSLDFIHAAALPLVGTSAIQALEEHINLQKSQKILIHGGAGGIGHVAIQLAKAIGAYVATTVSTEDIEFAKSLGADEVINYKQEKFEEKLKDFDAVFDTVGGETDEKSFQVLKKSGILVSMVGTNEEKAEEMGITAISQWTKTTTQHLNRLAQLVDEGKIRVNIDKQFNLDQAKEAFEYQEQVHPRGKVVFVVLP